MITLITKMCLICYLFNLFSQDAEGTGRADGEALEEEEEVRH